MHIPMHSKPTLQSIPTINKTPRYDLKYSKMRSSQALWQITLSVGFPNVFFSLNCFF